MSAQDIIRAWKDAAHRSQLSEEQRCNLPGNPAGQIELTDLDLGKAAGGYYNSFEFCPDTLDGCATGTCEWDQPLA